ncbi:MAG: hypothetical protein ETSY2_36910 [Candidatus Entotheonella gemina]|uniref:HTH cro/C1-type domain-containing protein n=1 Tax=Candidatus Entotheonella gemina TaxID=1429439 RepID=W4LW44_9BACT|nr:MAG: hypothetical protein ETSY2_36910 [Candidatus Entotheonella gemina]
MHDGYRVIEWAHQNDYDLSWVAEKIGYPVKELREALNRNHITKDLVDALFQHFKIRIAPTVLPLGGDSSCC